MSNFSKWIGATLGWSVGGPIGGILGFIVGSLVDGFTEGDINTAGQGPRTSARTAGGDFEISLLVLAAVVIKADGRSSKKEMDYVRDNFVRMYGKERANNAFKLFNELRKKGTIPTRQVCMQIREHMTHASRLQLLHFLFGIAQSDGSVSQSEIDAIKRISTYLYISSRDFESIKAMFYGSSSSSSSSTSYSSVTAYKILEITKTATDVEVKKAYRRMVKKHHPDKLRHLGEAHQKGAEEKFRQIQKAYEQIQAERGL
ncbi:TerB family tellurite resistance protein [Aureibaculum sp. A20]|uniref:TerB family tellurite resistance protein n=1 Tax=Aureibaculum flavum TaxID=2795986 RepID=A0ABS0WPD9_9FLAO|nr:TerB family tellurite resistance protein [Aureibaculum flavum]MBJ2173794.1 TerB family tellurite resistance protein [Aureibaculum flavum]